MAAIEIPSAVDLDMTIGGSYKSTGWTFAPVAQGTGDAAVASGRARDGRPVSLRIRSVEPFILHIPLNADSISDSTHTITHWGVVGTRIVTEDGLKATALPVRMRILRPIGS